MLLVPHFAKTLLDPAFDIDDNKIQFSPKALSALDTMNVSDKTESF